MQLTRTSPVVFECLGRRVQVASDSPRLARLVRTAWGEARGADAPVRRYDVAIEGTASPVLRGPHLARRLDPRQPVSHAYQIILKDVLGSVRDAFVLHATSVALDGRAMLLCGPSTFGKTTLAVHLATRGFALLSDDITLLRRDTGQIVPAARALNLRPGTRATLPADVLARARQAMRHPDPGPDEAGEWAVDPARWPGIAACPCALAEVVVLQPSRAPAERAPEEYDLQVIGREAAVLTDLGRRPGVREMRLHPGDPGRALVTVETPDVLAAWMRDHADAVVSASVRPPSRPGFDGPPELRPLRRSEAAIELCRQMLNRHEDSALGQEFRGSEAHLVAELASLLARSRCWSLIPGELGSTVDMLAGTFAEAWA